MWKKVGVKVSKRIFRKNVQWNFGLKIELWETTHFKIISDIRIEELIEERRIFQGMKSQKLKCYEKILQILFEDLFLEIHELLWNFVKLLLTF